MAGGPAVSVEKPVEQRAKQTPSGRLLLRMPAALHAELARTAEREGVSLNQFITTSLAERVRWGGAKPAAPAQAAEAPAARSRAVLVALIANAVVIGLAAVAALAILVLAWRG